MSVIRVMDRDLYEEASEPALEAGPQEHHSPVATAILLALRAYKIVLSPLLRGSCRFVPSCSDYAAEAVRRHGAGVGSWLALKRLARCHPLCRAGYDPVPSNEDRASGVRTQ